MDTQEFIKTVEGLLDMELMQHVEFTLKGDFDKYYRSNLNNNNVQKDGFITLGALKKDKKKIEFSINQTQFKKLQNLERIQGFEEKSSHTINFFRSGKIGEGKNKLNKNQKNILEKKFNTEMKELNYI